MLNLIIFRGVPGAGKSTLANLLCGVSPSNVRHFEADEYFVRPDGTYKYEREKIGAAHADCRCRLYHAMQDGHSQIVAGLQNDLVYIVSNVSASPYHMEQYENVGKSFGARIFHLVVENRHGNKDVHGVPIAAISKMSEALRGSIML